MSLNTNKLVYNLNNMKTVLVIGLYGCYCHPFIDWEDHDHFNFQKIKKFTIIKHRCTGEFGIVFSDRSIGGFKDIDFFPSDCPRCIRTEHVSNLIQYDDFSDEDKSKALNFQPKSYVNSKRLWNEFSKRNY